MRRKFSYQAVALAALFLSACAPVQTTPGGSPNPEASTEIQGPVIQDGQVDSQPVGPEVYGPEFPVAGAPATPTDATQATSTVVLAVPAPGAETATALGTSTITSTAAKEDAKLCLVLGPGMAKAMAEAAVLDVIRKAKIPVHCVVGTEMGAVVGALYSFLNGSTNGLQWQLFKLNKDNFLNFPMISLSEPRSSGRKLNEFFRAVFKDKRIEELPIPFATNAVEEERDNTVNLVKGDLASALSASVALPGIFEPWKMGQEAFHSAISADPAPIELARRLGGNFIVVVDVLLEGGAANSKSRYHRAFTAARSLMRLQKKEASFVIQVDASAIPFEEFGRQGEILAAGAKAAEKAMPELKAAWEKWLAGNK